MRGTFSFIGSVMLMLSGFKRRFVDWLLAGQPRTRLLPGGSSHVSHMTEDDVREMLLRELEGYRVSHMKFGENTISMGNPPGGVVEGVSWDTDSTLNARAQMGMDTASGEPQWYGGVPDAQRSIFDIGVGTAVVSTAGKIQNMADPTLPQDGATKNYVDSVAGGAAWRNPVCVTNYIGNLTLAQVNAIATIDAGTACIADNTDGIGWPATPTAAGSELVAAGDTIELNAAGAWIVIIPHNGSNVPPGASDLSLQWGTRVLVSKTYPIQTSTSSPLVAGDLGKILEWAGVNLIPAQIDSLSGYAVLVNCKNAGGTPSIDENEAYSYQGVIPAGEWVLFQGAVPPHQDLTGLTGGGFDGDAGHNQLALLGGRSAAESGSNSQTINGGTLAGGNLRLHSNATDGATTLGGDIILGATSVLPTVHENVNMGLSGTQFGNFFFKNGNIYAALRIHGLSSSVRPDVTAQGKVGTSLAVFLEGWFKTMTVQTMLQGGAAGTGAHLNIQGNPSLDGDVQVASGSDLKMMGSDNIITAQSPGGTVGEAANRFASLFVNTADIATAVVPDVDNGADCGGAVLRWANFYTQFSNFYDTMTLHGAAKTFIPNADNEGAIGTFGTGKAFANLEVHTAGFQADMTMRGDNFFSPSVDLEGQIGRAKIAATGQLGGVAEFNQPVSGNTIGINGRTYTFRTVLSTLPDIADEILIDGVTLAATMANVVLAINLGAGIGVNYSNGTVINADVTAAEGGTNIQVIITAKVAGTGPNAFALAQAMFAGAPTWTAGTLLGGVDAVRFKSVTAQVINMGDAVMERNVNEPGYNGEHVKVRLKEYPEGIMAINELTGEQKWMLQWDAP